MLKFDAETTRLFDIVYQGADVTRRRQASFDALQPGPEEAVLDLGCGGGHLTVELARAVGVNGRIIGVDPSQDMRRAARQRCTGYHQVEIVEGSGNQIPISSESIDKAVSVQVFEYLSDILGAVRELHRVLKPDGRLVIADIHLDSLVWFSDVPERMARMIAAWDHHFAERAVPAILPPILRQEGFIVDAVTPLTICDTQLKPDGLANMMMILMEKFAVSNGHISRDEAGAWRAEQRDLAAAGRFFFSLGHFVVSSRAFRV